MIPDRLQRTKVHTVPDAVPKAWGQDMGRWLHAQRHLLAPVSLNDQRWHYEMPVDDCELAPEFRRCLFEHLKPALDTLRIMIEPGAMVEFGATLHHHRHGGAWTRATDRAPEASLAFSLFLNSLPKQYTGGELEFQDGFSIEPQMGCLVFWPAPTIHRVRVVECYAAHAIYGRWSLSGTVAFAQRVTP